MMGRNISLSPSNLGKRELMRTFRIGPMDSTASDRDGAREDVESFVKQLRPLIAAIKDQNLPALRGRDRRPAKPAISDPSDISLRVDRKTIHKLRCPLIADESRSSAFASGRQVAYGNPCSIGVGALHVPGVADPSGVQPEVRQLFPEHREQALHLGSSERPGARTVAKASQEAPVGARSTNQNPSAWRLNHRSCRRRTATCGRDPGRTRNTGCEDSRRQETNGPPRTSHLKPPCLIRIIYLEHSGCCARSHSPTFRVRSCTK